MDRERTFRGANARGVWILFALRQRNYGLVCGIENALAGGRTDAVASLVSDRTLERPGWGWVERGPRDGPRGSTGDPSDARARSDEAGDALVLDLVRDVTVGGVELANRGLFRGEVDGPSGALLVDGETLAAVDGRAGRASLAVELAVVHQVVQRARVDVVRLVVLLCTGRRFGEDDAHVSKKRPRRTRPGFEARRVARARRGP